MTFRRSTIPQKQFIIIIRTQVHIKIALSKNTFQNIVAYCLITYNFLKVVFLNLLKKIKKVNNEADRDWNCIPFLKKSLENFYY